jgi:hypothetical protein
MLADLPQEGALVVVNVPGPLDEVGSDGARGLGGAERDALAEGEVDDVVSEGLDVVERQRKLAGRMPEGVVTT